MHQYSMICLVPFCRAYDKEIVRASRIIQEGNIQYFFSFTLVKRIFDTPLLLERPLLSYRTSTSDSLFIKHLYRKKISKQDV